MANNDGSLITKIISNVSETVQGDQFTLADVTGAVACVNYQNNIGNAGNAFDNNGASTFTLYYNGNNQLSSTSGAITPGDADSCPLNP